MKDQQSEKGNHKLRKTWWDGKSKAGYNSEEAVLMRKSH